MEDHQLVRFIWKPCVGSAGFTEMKKKELKLKRKFEGHSSFSGKVQSTLTSLCSGRTSSSVEKYKKFFVNDDTVP